VETLKRAGRTGCWQQDLPPAPQVVNKGQGPPRLSRQQQQEIGPETGPQTRLQQRPKVYPGLYTSIFGEGTDSPRLSWALGR